jgi:7,8-dihydropterin-6-yl-methyl-4-(beta-D-ribofuranosyl)aminobenzene 5'-phosphate synthase
MRLTILAGILTAAVCAPASTPARRITVLYDAFGSRPELQKDWGYSALVEYDGKRILFDTGNDAAIFAANVKKLGVDLRKLDFVVISHRHADHTAGLNYLLKVNPKVRIYTPLEVFGVFGGQTPKGFYRREPSLPSNMRYFGGDAKEQVTTGTMWPGANFSPVDGLIEISPGIHLVATVSQVAGTLEMRELTLALTTPNGLVLVAGCSHPGIVKIIESAAPIGKPVHMIFGGLHLAPRTVAEATAVAAELHDKWKVARVAVGHCTGEPAFAAFKTTFGEDYLYAGLGSVLDVP